jgi:RnfABCDGE-type electron transport complex B subunit
MERVQFAVIILGLTGFCFGVVLAFLSKKLAIQEDPRMAEILSLLPGLNCGACGFSGCRAFAEAVIKQKDLFSGCLPGGQEANRGISRILGLDESGVKKTKVVVCRCGADAAEKKVSLRYQGPQTCRAAHITGGALDCVWGCIGFGDCLGVCPTGALTLKGRKIYVDVDRCTGCGQCIKACPRNLFELIPYSRRMHTCYVACNNKDKAVYVKSVCSRGCIGCGLCTRVSDSPYYMKDNLSHINYGEAILKQPLLEGRGKCPTRCIFEIYV